MNKYVFRIYMLRVIALLVISIVLLFLIERYINVNSNDSVDAVKTTIDSKINDNGSFGAGGNIKCSMSDFDCNAQSLSNMKIYAGGSGEDLFSQPETAKEIIELSGKSQPNVLYLGTATYDSSKGFNKQTDNFTKLGCNVVSLDVARRLPNGDGIVKLFEETDVILVSGGNTLFAVDRWNQVGIDKLIRKALLDGKVLCGGSAGGIVWFDGGHSDSMDPSTYLDPPGPFINSGLSKKQLDTSWAYIRVPGLSILPGLFCPHYDKVEGNGQLRASNFSDIMRLHSGETGIALDNWAALKINGRYYEVISRKDKTGSVDKNGNYVSNSKMGRPGGWTLETEPITGRVVRRPLPEKGEISDILIPAKYIVQSQMLPVARKQNPIPV